MSHVIKEAAANLQKNVETVGGKLLLTNEELIFKPHIVNVQTGEVVVKILEISAVEKCWTKFLGFIPLFPNSIRVSLKSGENYCFVVTQRDQWISKVLEQNKG